jgi:hypothetical protein
MMSDTVYDEYLINTSLLKMRNKGKHFCLPSIYILFICLDYLILACTSLVTSTTLVPVYTAAPSSKMKV